MGYAALLLRHRNESEACSLYAEAWQKREELGAELLANERAKQVALNELNASRQPHRELVTARATALLDGSDPDNSREAAEMRLRAAQEREPVLRKAIQLQDKRVLSAHHEAARALCELLEPQAQELRERLCEALIRWALACEAAEQFREPLIAQRIHTSGLLPPFPYGKWRLEPSSPTDWLKVDEYLKDAAQLGVEVKKLKKRMKKQVSKEVGL